MGKYFFTSLIADTLAGFFCYTANLHTGNHSLDSFLFGPPEIVDFVEHLRNNIMIGLYLYPIGVYEFFTKTKLLSLKTNDACKKLIEFAAKDTILNYN